MSRTKSHSSNLAIIKDLAQKIIQEVDTAQTIFDQFIEDSKRLKEIEPALNRLQAVLKPAITTMPLTEPATEPPVEPPTQSPAEVVKRTKRIRKVLASTTEETPSNLTVG